MEQKKIDFETFKEITKLCIGMSEEDLLKMFNCLENHHCKLPVPPKTLTQGFSKKELK